MLLFWMEEYVLEKATGYQLGMQRDELLSDTALAILLPLRSPEILEM